jgi:hypothetical protein
MEKNQHERDQSTGKEVGLSGRTARPTDTHKILCIIL